MKIARLRSDRSWSSSGIDQNRNRDGYLVWRTYSRRLIAN